MIVKTRNLLLTEAVVVLAEVVWSVCGGSVGAQWRNSSQRPLHPRYQLFIVASLLLATDFVQSTYVLWLGGLYNTYT